MTKIDFVTDHRLSDTLALQLFLLQSHLLRRGLLLAICLLGAVALNSLMNGAPLADALADLTQNAARYVTIVLAGLSVIYLVALTLAVLSWRRRPRPRQIRATIAADTITLQKDGFNYGARWADADLVTEDPSAFLMKFNQLYMRLPKRGFAPGEEALFRKLAAAGAPESANRLKP